ncbi:hypothetical protein CA54_28600 [Symmachiella macrocystis]|uniref:Uncharacterized protein n=1 Tax=Symmachiella macrocystis TaxID=2527985 RepID=A0A5C6BPM0_9PLAN|nr:hypothetical protein CA54_28600 [Symmachiella macrocystis]
MDILVLRVVQPRVFSGDTFALTDRPKAIRSLESMTRFHIHAESQVVAAVYELGVIRSFEFKL